MEFPHVFWDPELAYFGAAVPGGAAGRGAASIFWNLAPLTGRPQLTALISGAAAYEGEKKGDEELRDVALRVLKRLYEEEVVPEPTGLAVTRWKAEAYSRGQSDEISNNPIGLFGDQLLDRCKLQ